jgi:dihydroorotate dehydrogenase
MHLITLFTKLLNFLPGEISHHIALVGLKFLNSIGLLRLLLKTKLNLKQNTAERDIRNLTNQVGIAAGLDKNGDYIDCLAALGIDFIEVGTVTPKPQSGNPKPRIFRNREEKSLLNRLGFNNKGVDHLVKKLKTKKSNIIVGTSIGKNFDTPNDKAFEDYVLCLEKVYELSDYIAINISSPNTKDLRELSSSEFLNSLLQNLNKKRDTLADLYGYRPILVKISPDETSEDLKMICKSILVNSLDGIICSNTTVQHKNKNGSGGVSGAPLKVKATSNLISVKKLVGDRLTIIASGGVMSVQDFQDKIEAGAEHVQLYTGFIFEGPKLIQDINNLNSD